MMYVSRQMHRNALSSPVATGMPGLCSLAPFGKPTLRIVHPIRLRCTRNARNARNARHSRDEHAVNVGKPSKSRCWSQSSDVKLISIITYQTYH